MPVPPSVPTSFVPQRGAPVRRSGDFDFGGAFAFIGYGAFLLALLFSGGVFAYEWYLKGVETRNIALLEEAESRIDDTTVQGFLRLNNRLIEGKRLLNGHIAFSGLLAAVEELIPTGVRLKSLDLSVGDQREAILRATGSAASLNALAAFSASLGGDATVKDAVFSSITIAKGGSVDFSLSATVTKEVITFGRDAVSDQTPTP